MTTSNHYEREVKNKIVEELTIYFYDYCDNYVNKIEKLVHNYNYIKEGNDYFFCITNKFINKLWFQQFKSLVLFEIVEDKRKLLLLDDNNYKKEFYSKNLDCSFNSITNELLKTKEGSLLALLSSNKNDCISLSTKLNDYIMINNNIYKLITSKYDSEIIVANEKIKNLENLIKYVLVIFTIILSYNCCSNN